MSRIEELEEQVKQLNRQVSILLVVVATEHNELLNETMETWGELEGLIEQVDSL